MELYFGEERGNGSTQSCQTLFCAGYRYSAGTLYNNTNQEAVEKNGAPSRDRPEWVASMQVPKPIQAIHGDRNDGHYHEQVCSSVHGDDRDEVVQFAHEWMNDKLKDYQALEQKWMGILSMSPPLDGDFISPAIDDGKHLIHGELLGDNGDKIDVVITPKQYMGLLHGYHNPAFEANPRGSRRASLECQLLNPSVVDIDTGRMQRIDVYTDSRANRVKVMQAQTDVLFRQAEYGMTDAQREEYRDGLLAKQSIPHPVNPETGSNAKIYAVEIMNGYSPTGWSVSRYSLRTSDSEGVRVFNSVPASDFGSLNEMGRLRRLVTTEKLETFGMGRSGSHYAVDPVVVPVDIKPAPKVVITDDFSAKAAAMDGLVGAAEKTATIGMR